MLKRLLALLILSCVFAAGMAEARADIARSAWAEEEQSAVRLIAARDGLGEDGKVLAGLQFRLKPGWKVYWRSPGDAGYPPQPDFGEMVNAAAGELRWPVPERFSVLGLETLGYEDEVILPFDVSAADLTRDAEIRATVRYLTCKEICIPYDASVSMTLPAGDGAPTGFAHDIGRYESRVPRTGEAARLKVVSAWTEASEKGLYIAARATSELPFKGLDLYVEGPIGFGYGAPAVRIDNASREALLRVPVSGFSGTPWEAAEKLTGTPVTLTLRDGGRAAAAAAIAARERVRARRFAGADLHQGGLPHDPRQAVLKAQFDENALQQPRAV